MPFIWNDTVFKFLDENESFDIAEYVIVRKLFVQLVSAFEVSHKFISSCVNPSHQPELSPISQNSQLQWTKLNIFSGNMDQ